MTRRLYTKAREGILDQTISLPSDVLVVHGVFGYVFNAAHQFVSDLGVTIVETTLNLGGRGFTDGIFSAANTQLPFVTVGETIDGLVIAQSTGGPGTDRLVYYTDETGDATLPWIGTGAPVVINWGGSIFALNDCT